MTLIISSLWFPSETRPNTLFNTLFTVCYIYHTFRITSPISANLKVSSCSKTLKKIFLKSKDITRVTLTSTFLVTVASCLTNSKDVALRIRIICSSGQYYLEKLKEYMTYLVRIGHSPKKVKLTFENVGKMTRTEARVKKRRTVNKSTIIFPAKYNPKGPDLNAIIKRHEYALQNNTIWKSYFQQILLLLQIKE